MQFNPSKKERYAAALRKIIAKRLLAQKEISKNLKLLKIILVFSALCREQTKEKFKLFECCQKLLTETRINFSLKGEKSYEIDYYLLKLLILELVSAPHKEQIVFRGEFLKNRIIFTVKNAELTQIAKALIKKLNGVLIKTRGESNFAVMLSAPCVLKTQNLIEDTEDFKNPFSSINIMIFQ